MKVEDRNDLVMILCILAVLVALIFALAPDGNAEVEPFQQGPASQPTEVKPPFHWGYWTAAGALAGSAVIDGVTTVHVIGCGGTETGSAWLYGRHPGPGAYARGVLLWELPKAVFAYRFRNSPHWFLRYPGLVLMAYDTEEHFRGAVHNLQQRCR